jgi:hypothetical protein
MKGNQVRLFIGTPCYGGVVSARYMQSGSMTRVVSGSNYRRARSGTAAFGSAGTDCLREYLKKAQWNKYMENPDNHN